MANLVDVDLTHQPSGRVYHGQEIVVGAGENVDELAQQHVGLYGDIVFLDERIHTHQCEHALVGVVGDEFAFTG